MGGTKSNKFITALLVAATAVSALVLPDSSGVIAQTAPAYEQDFESFVAGDQPTGWADTAAGNSMNADDSLFSVSGTTGTNALTTTSTASNIHSHVTGAPATAFADSPGYTFTGRLRIDQQGAGVGVTFFSDYTNADTYYRLRRYGNTGSFRLSPHGTSITSGLTDTGVVPTAGAWYRFEIQVVDAGTSTDIKAKVWADGTPVPGAWQIDATDSSATRLTSGTIGVWSYRSGAKHWDDLTVADPIATPEYGVSLSTIGSGTATVDPDLASYPSGSTVQITGTPASGWVFTGWSGGYTGNDNPATIVVTENTVITANFAEIQPVTLDLTTSGNGTVVSDPDQIQHDLGTTVTLTATPDAGQRFVGWSGDLSGAANPAPLSMNGDKVVVANFAEDLPGLVNDNFDNSPVGADPIDWLDTAANNSMVPNDALFSVADVGTERALTTASSGSNVHSHFVGAGAATAGNYDYAGRMLVTNAKGGIGVTFLSDYPNSDTYYRLRRYGNNGSFKLSPHGTALTGGTVDSGVVPAAGTWYRFRVSVLDTAGRTEIRAKIWADGTTEPAQWQIDAFDDSANRLVAGTVGAWSWGNGTKAWDDLSVQFATAPGPVTLTTNVAGSGTVTADPALAQHDWGSVVSLTAQPDPGWEFTGWSGDVSSTDNPVSITMSADRSVTANFVEIPAWTLTTAVIGQGVVTVDPQSATYDDGEILTLTAAPAAGWIFTGWSGDIGGSASPATLTMSTDRSITATFIEDTSYTLTVGQQGQGTTNISPDQVDYAYGETVAITATPASGWRLAEWITDPAVSNGWWDQAWDYRLPVTVDAAGTQRVDVVADIGVDFTSAWSAIGASGEFDPDSLRVVEVDANGAIVDPDVIFQFDPATTFDPNTSANGTLSVFVAGTTLAGAQRSYHVYYDDAAKSLPTANVAPLITVTDGVDDEGLTTVRVASSTATYFYDKQGGGFSSIVDVDGNDWISHNSASGSAGEYRGVPNLAYPENIMHPGEPGVTTTIEHQGPLKVTLRSASLDGTWVTLWEIGPSTARMTVLAADHSYWFLYEGTPGGSLDPASDIVVRSDGTQTSAAQAWTGDLPGEEWVYFGDPLVGAAGRSMFFVNHDQDTAADSYYPLNGNMTVFGFGRSGASSFLDAVPNTFTLGLTDGIAQGPVSAELLSSYRTIITAVGTAQDRGAGSSAATLTFAVTADTTVTAVFAELAPIVLDTSTTGNGSLVIDPDQPTYLPGDTVTITASADSGSYFAGWSGDQGGTANPLLVTLSDNTTIVGNFSVDGGLTIDATVSGSGTVALDPDQATYSYGQSVTVTAIATNGDVFAGWGGDLSGLANPQTITVNGNNSFSAAFEAANANAPVIDVWYGDQQEFGHIGRPQRWQNVLGNVSDPDGVAALSYTLNGGASRNLSIGPDSRRLFRAGDFNIDIDDIDLVNGDNTVVITAVDGSSEVSTKTIIVDHQSNNVWPQTETVDWGSATVIHDVAQPIDGQWELENDGVRSVDPAYDRLLGIGDVAWTDYEVVFPVTVNAVDATGFSSSSSGRGAGIGVLFRWNGHTDFPVQYPQPKTGYLPYGAIGWYWYDSPTRARLRIDGNNQVVLDESANNIAPAVGVEYMIKMRVTTEPGVGGLYELKSWPSSQPEPSAWEVSGQESMTDPQTGSIMLVAHHVDATFGDVVVTPIGASVGTIDATTVGNGTVTVDPDQAEYSYGEQVTVTATPDTGWEFTGWQGDLSGSQNPATINLAGPKQVTAVFADASAPPLISNINVTAFADSAVVTWTTDKAADSVVDYGQTTAYGSTASDLAQVTEHSVTLGGLVDDTLHHFQVTSTGSNGNPATSADATFTTLDGSNPSGLQSDDFNECTVDNSRWTLIDAIGDGSASVDGTRLELAVPGGVAHDVWTGGNNSVRLMQAANDADFELDVKFESPVTSSYQLQGLIIGQDPANFLRLDFYGNNGQTYLFAATFVNGNPTIVANVPVTLTGSTSYMRVSRTGDDWVQQWSDDGVTWLTNVTFTHAIVVSEAGVFAGNAGGNAPAHTAVVDYIFNTASPILPEDGTTQNCGGNTGDTTPPVISAVSVDATAATATVTWTTDETASGEVEYGPTASYGSSVTGASELSHSVTITGLQADTTYHYAVTSVDAAGNSTTSANATFITDAGSTGPTFVSDDFNACAPDTNVWSFVDPVGDGSVTVNGSQLELSVPGGVAHDVWSSGNNAVRLVQPATDDDLDIIAKFDSTANVSYQLQGVIVGQDNSNFVRFDFYGHNGNTYAFVARFVNGSPTVIANVAIAAGSSTHMRITRTGDLWSQQWSVDGATWSTTASFTHEMTVTEVGPFAGNAGGGAPAHTATIDYFFDAAGSPDPSGMVSCP